MVRKQRLYTTLALLLVVMIVVCIFLPGCAQSLFYYPDQKDYGSSPARQNLSYEDVTFSSTNGAQLHGWFVPAGNGLTTQQAKGTVIQVHGNAGNLTGHWSFIEWLPAYGYNVFAFDYQGYGQSEGKPNPKKLFEDTQSAIDYVRVREDIDPQKLLIIGQSLGGNNSIAAVGSGNKQGICAMVIDSTFYSYASIANDKLPGAGILTNNHYSANKFVKAIAPIPLLFIHGKKDDIIPYKHSQRLFDLANEPKELVLIENGVHISALLEMHGNVYKDLVDKFFMRALGNCQNMSKVDVSK